MLVSTMGELSCTTAAEGLSACAELLATFCKFIAINEKAPREVDLPRFLTSSWRQPCLPRQDNACVAEQFPQRNIGTDEICAHFQAVSRWSKQWPHDANQPSARLRRDLRNPPAARRAQERPRPAAGHSA